MKPLLKVITNEELLKIEPDLRRITREHYNKDYSFETGSRGDQILQAARIAVFQISKSYGNVANVLEDRTKREELFEEIESILKAEKMNYFF